MATSVIRATRSLSAWVVCDTPEVATLATTNGAGVIWRASKGLNQAVQDGMTFLTKQGYERVVIAHADLPLANDLSWVANRLGEVDVVIVPDRRMNGTNVMGLSVSTPGSMEFRFAYGPGSCEAHQDEANRTGRSYHVVPDEDLGWDVDTDDDLVVFETHSLLHRGS